MDSSQITDTAWSGDLFDRKTESDYLIETLANLYQREGEAAKKSLVLAVNAEWGAGKTFFLRYFARDLEEAGHPVICFDAWANDYAEDALLSFLAEMLEQLAAKLPKHHQVVAQLKEKALAVVKAVVKVGAHAVLKKGISMGLNEFSDEITPKEDKDSDDLQGKLQDAIGNAIFDSHKSKKQAIEAFRVALRGLLASIAVDDKRKPPIFVLVDELDRCRPDFSIKLLEGIKHIFAVEGVYFVLGINQGQLQESIKVLYGNSFQAHGYLKRFIDMEYALLEPAGNAFITSQFRRNGYEVNCPELLCLGEPGPADVLQYIFTSHRMKLRDQEQVAFHIFSICDVLLKKHGKVFFSYLAQLACLQHLGQSLLDMASCRRFISGSQIRNDFPFMVVTPKQNYDSPLKQNPLSYTMITLFDLHWNMAKVRGNDWDAGSVQPAELHYLRGAYPNPSPIPAPYPLFSCYPDLVMRAGLLKNTV